MRNYLFVLILLSGCASPPYMGDLESAWESEAKAYSAMLTAKMDRGELSEEEAKYLWTQKVNELSQRYENAQRARQPQRSTTTRCSPDGYGGIRCR